MPPQLVVALGSYPESELRAIRARGIPLVILAEVALLSQRIEVDTLPNQEKPIEAVLRAPRLPDQTYEYLYKVLEARRISLINTPAMVRRTSQFDIHYPLIRESTPRTVSLPATCEPDALCKAIHEVDLVPPLFIKTEIKSLKDRSVVNKITTETVEVVLCNLHNEISGFARIIVREIVPLRHLPQEPKTALEYRAFIMHNRIVAVQANTQNPDYLEDSWQRAARFYDHWCQKLAAYDFSNFYVMDIAMLATSNDFVIIEIKEGQYTQIRDAELFWASC